MSETYKIASGSRSICSVFCAHLATEYANRPRRRKVAECLSFYGKLMLMNRRDGRKFGKIRGDNLLIRDTSVNPNSERRIFIRLVVTDGSGDVGGRVMVMVM